MRLTARLQAIADMIDVNTTVFDIGCDHAYLDIYLTLYRKNIKCIAVDNKHRVIVNAVKNIDKYNLKNKITVIESNGLDNLSINQNDIVILSGLGTSTIIKILLKDIYKLPNTIIIQSNNDIVDLRKKLVNMGFYIDMEEWVVDNNKDYIIIKFKKGNIKYSFIDFMAGPILKNNKAYLEKIINRYNDILIEIPRKNIIRKMHYKYLIFRLKKRL